MAPFVGAQVDICGHQGARRVGKSTLAEEFAKNEYENYILIDFSNCKPQIKRLFDDSSDLNYIFLRLQKEPQSEIAPKHEEV